MCAGFPLHLHPQSIMAPVLLSPSTWTAPSSPRNSSATISGAWWTQSGSQEPLGLHRTVPRSGNQPVVGGQCLSGEISLKLNVYT